MARAAAVMEASVAAEMVVVVMAVVVMAAMVPVHHLEARVTVRAEEEMEAATAEGGRGEALAAARAEGADWAEALGAGKAEAEQNCT